MDPITLPPEMIGKIHRAQKRLTSLITELDKCENCGIPVEKFREIISEQLTTLQRLEQNFGTPNYQQMKPIPSFTGASGDSPEQ